MAPLGFRTIFSRPSSSVALRMAPAVHGPETAKPRRRVEAFQGGPVVIGPTVEGAQAVDRSAVSWEKYPIASAASSLVLIQDRDCVHWLILI